MTRRSAGARARPGPRYPNWNASGWSHQRGVGLVTVKPADEPRWSLIKAVRPDVLVATADTYTADEIAELEDKYCGRVEVLDRMATVSTSARLRLLQLQSMASEDRGA